MNYKSAITPTKQMCKQLKEFCIDEFNCNNVKTFTRDKLLDSN